MLLEKAAVTDELRSLLDLPQQKELPDYVVDAAVQNRVGKYLSDIAASERMKQRSLKVLAEVARRSGDAGSSHWE